MAELTIAGLYEGPRRATSARARELDAGDGCPLYRGSRGGQPTGALPEVASRLLRWMGRREPTDAAALGGLPVSLVEGGKERERLWGAEDHAGDEPA